MAPHGSRLIIPVPAAAAEPVVNALLTHKHAADSVALVAAVVFGSKRAPSPWEQPCYFRPLCAAHILPASPQARHANDEARASGEDGGAARGSCSSLPNRILYFEL